MSERQLVRERDINHWLAPPEDVAHDLNFQVTDLASKCSARFGNTCEWITDDPQYKKWSNSTSSTTLWIESGPGTGKTVLASYIITHQLALSNQRCFYYFFRGTDSYLSTPLAAAKCLLSQIYLLCQRDHPTMTREFDLLAAAVIEDGYTKSKSFDRTWSIFVSFASSLPGGCRVIIDGLDECSQPKYFLGSLLALSAGCPMPIKIAVTCRSSTIKLDDNNTVDVLSLGSNYYDDIRKYTTHRVSNFPVQIPPELMETVVDRLSKKHNGMFLWVTLVLEEPESMVTVEELKRALDDLPEKLDEVYDRIIRELDNRLTKAQRRLSCGWPYPIW
jgi:hypothetical protein